MNELISIIIPVYNVEKYLDRCITSVIKQTYSNLEIILVDDGSTDKSGILCEQWKKKDDRIIIIHKNNGGLSDARNHGIKCATGRYISFIDSDDFVDSRFIEVLYDIICKTGTSIAVVDFKITDGDEITKEGDYAPECTEALERKDAIRCLLKSDKIYNYAWNKLYKKDLFENIEYPFGRKMEDLGTTYKLFNKAGIVSYNPCKLYYYYQRKDSIIHVTGQGFYEDKYVLVLERFNALKADKDLLVDNAFFTFHGLIDCYPHIQDTKQNEARLILKDLWGVCKNNCNIKSIIKYYFIMHFEHLYVRVFWFYQQRKQKKS